MSHADALLALKSIGLSATDVTLTQVGNDAARLAALKAGSVAASISDGTQIEPLKALGFNILVNLSDVEGLGGVPRTSLTFRQGFVAKNPNTVLALTAMDYEALTLWRANPAKATEALGSLENVDAATATAEFAALMKEKWEPLNGRCDPTILEFTKAQQVVVNADLASVDGQKACTNKYLDQLDVMGWEAQPGPSQVAPPAPEASPRT